MRLDAISFGASYSPVYYGTVQQDPGSAQVREGFSTEGDPARACLFVSKRTVMLASSLTCLDWTGRVEATEFAAGQRVGLRLHQRENRLHQGF